MEGKLLVVIAAAAVLTGCSTGKTVDAGPAETAPTSTARPSSTRPVAAFSVPLAQRLACFGRPAGCGYPDAFAGWSVRSGVGPNDGRRGVGCSALRRSGSIDVTRDGRTVRNVDVRGQIRIDASNVTIDNVCVAFGGANQGGSQAVVVRGGSRILIENSDIGGVNATNDSVEAAVADNGGSGVTLARDYLHNCIECLHDHPFTVRDSYVISNGGQSVTGLHTEDLYYNNDYPGLNVSFEHDTLFNPYYQTAVVFADDYNGPSDCLVSLTVKNSLLSGGGGNLVWCGKTGSPGSATFDVQNNHFARCTTRPFVKTGGGNATCSGVSRLAWEYPVLAGTKTGADVHGYYRFGGSYASNGMNYCRAGTWKANVWDDNGATLACRN